MRTHHPVHGFSFLSQAPPRSESSVSGAGHAAQHTDSDRTLAHSTPGHTGAHTAATRRRRHPPRGGFTVTCRPESTPRRRTRPESPSHGMIAPPLCAYAHVVVRALQHAHSTPRLYHRPAALPGRCLAVGWHYCRHRGRVQSWSHRERLPPPPLARRHTRRTLSRPQV